MLKMTAEMWNTYYPPGTEVLFEPVKGRGALEQTKTTSEAWALGSGTVVVKIEGRSGGCAVDHMAPIKIAERSAK